MPEGAKGTAWLVGGVSWGLFLGWVSLGEGLSHGRSSQTAPRGLKAEVRKRKEMEERVGKEGGNLEAESRRQLSCLSEQVAADSGQNVPV